MSDLNYEELYKASLGRIAELEAELKEAEKDLSFLQALRDCGVDNWEGYEMAADAWRSENPDEDE